MKIIHIATRKSPLALWQAEHIKALLLANNPQLTIELLPMTTQGDQLMTTALTKIGGKGLFVKELERALFDKKADLAVHSMKDMPMELPAGLSLAVICRRDDPRDAFVSNDYEYINELPASAKVGTSSLRRQCQLKALFPQLNVALLRGNVNTRLSKLDAGEFDAIILAAAGLERLGFSDRIQQYFSLKKMLPAPGQGALGIECREDDELIQQLIAPLHDPITAQCVQAEREVSRRLGGNCQLPLAVYGQMTDWECTLRGLVGSPDGSKLIRSTVTGSHTEIAQLSTSVAEELLQQGADTLLQQLA